MSPPSTLDEAIERNDMPAVERFLGAEPTPVQVTIAEKKLLHAAAEAGAVDVIRALLAAGAALDAQDDDDQTALHVAVANGHAEAVEALTCTQPCHELEVYDKYKMLPLHLACEGGSAEIVALLLARGARVLTTPASPTRPGAPDAAAAATAAAAADADGQQAVNVEEPKVADAGSSIVPPQRQPNFGGSPVPKRKQLIAMQKSDLGGSAIFLARQHNHTDVVGLLERAASGESIAMPVLSERSTASSAGG